MAKALTVEDYKQLTAAAMKEDELQVKCMSYARIKYPHTLIFHVPNGGLRSKREAARFKAMGVLAGVPDILVMDARGGYAGACFELKRMYKGRLSEAQKLILEKMKGSGYKVHLVYSLDEFMSLLDAYMNSPLTEVKRGI